MDNFRDAIIDTLQYIEANLTEELSLDMLAKRVNYSKFYFSKGFFFYVGTSIMDYVNTRRLIHAAYEINLGKKASEVTFNYGFDTQTGFIKAFKRKFGITPLKFKNTLEITIPQLTINKMIEKNIKGEILMEPKILRKEKFTIAGYSITTSTVDHRNLIEIPQFWNDYLIDGRMEKLHNEKFVKSHEEYGACLPGNGKGEFKYLIGVETNGEEIPSEYETYEVVSQLYAVFTTPKATNENFAKKIQETWSFIYKTWLPNSPYKFDEKGIDFELYDQRCFCEDKVIDIYIPVKEK